MKVIDAVNSSIKRYPSLYLRQNWEDSKFAVLHHYFIILGTGVVWAITDQPEEGGYLTEPKYKKVKGEKYPVRQLDRPYGQEVCKLDKRYYKESLYEVCAVDKEMSQERKRYFRLLDSEYKQPKYVFQSDIKKLKIPVRNVDPYREDSKHFLAIVNNSDINEDKGSPYPNFQKQYSCFWKPQVEFIQDDWREAAIEHLTFWKEYFNDSERVKGYSSYPNPKDLGEYILKHYSDKENWIATVARQYEFADFDGDFKKLAQHRWDKELLATQKFLKQTLHKLKK